MIFFLDHLNKVHTKRLLQENTVPEIYVLLFLLCIPCNELDVDSCWLMGKTSENKQKKPITTFSGKNGMKKTWSSRKRHIKLDSLKFNETKGTEWSMSSRYSTWSRVCPMWLPCCTHARCHWAGRPMGDEAGAQLDQNWATNCKGQIGSDSDTCSIHTCIIY